MSCPGSKRPRRTLPISPVSGKWLHSALPQLEQKDFAQPSSGLYVFTNSSPASNRNDPGASRACAEAAVPVRRWHRVQWQYPADNGSSVTSKRTPPHMQCPVYIDLHDNQDVRTTAKADYAVRAAIELAAHGDAPVSAERIAEAQQIPVNFLENILLDLRRAGIVDSRRGAAGGYLLARPANEIVIADVVRAVEGPLASVRGLSPDALEYEGSAEQSARRVGRPPLSRPLRARARHARRRREREAPRPRHEAHAGTGRVGSPLSLNVRSTRVRT